MAETLGAQPWLVRSEATRSFCGSVTPMEIEISEERLKEINANTEQYLADLQEKVGEPSRRDKRFARKLVRSIEREHQRKNR